MLEGEDVELDKKNFQKMFPNLAKELESDEHSIPMNSVRGDKKTGEGAASKKFVNYVPDVIDFLRRCDSDKQGEEIIAYMEKRREIPREYAAKLRVQLREKGIRSFGSKKDHDYYLKHDQ